MIKTIILSGWFLITIGTKDDDKYNYLLEDAQHNVYVALSVDKPLPYPVNTWGKFTMKAECDIVQTQEQAGRSIYSVPSKFCNADSYKIATCVRPMIVNGVKYCG